MRRSSTFCLGSLSTFIFTLAIIATGCSKSPTTAFDHSSSPYHLKTEPTGAVEILDLKDQAQDGAPVVVVGRLGGGITPWVDGRAAFLLVDTRISPSCEEGGVCKADCPDCAKELASASAMVKFLGEDGKVISVDARKLLGVNELETIVVQGVTNRDKEGNVTVSAKGIFVRR